MGLFSSLFGSSSKSKNKAYGQVSEGLGSTIAGTGQYTDALSQLLGGGFQGYLDNSGFDTQLGQGLDNIDAGAAASGLLRSGSTAKAYGDYTTGLQQQYYGNYLDRLLQNAQLGVSAAGTLASVGQKSKGGNAGIAGGLLSGIGISERRLKSNIEKIGELEDGLGIYSFSYKGDPYETIHIGVMVDEVETLRPEALGPKVWDIQTVNYDKLEVV
jgi:hypothetical protein